MKEIQLTQGQVALVDDEDFEELNKYNWSALRGKTTWYAVRSVYSGKTHMLQRMHALLAGKGHDHRDHNGLNNQRYNLRPATTAQNLRNRRKFATNNPYKGVYPKGDKYQCRIRIDGKLQHFGTFSDPVVAAKKYDQVVTELHAEFAQLNFPVDSAAAVM
jgi:hypothetical protein